MTEIKTIISHSGAQKLRPRLALIAHDQKKDDMVAFCKKHRAILEKYELIATGTTGQRIMDEIQLDVLRMKSGPLGGDFQIGSLIASGEIDAVFFFRDPLTAHPHEPDVTGFLRLCEVYNIPMATNPATAELVVKNL